MQISVSMQAIAATDPLGPDVPPEELRRYAPGSMSKWSRANPDHAISKAYLQYKKDLAKFYKKDPSGKPKPFDPVGVTKKIAQHPDPAYTGSATPAAPKAAAPKAKIVHLSDEDADKAHSSPVEREFRKLLKAREEHGLEFEVSERLKKVKFRITAEAYSPADLHDTQRDAIEGAKRVIQAAAKQTGLKLNPYREPQRPAHRSTPYGMTHAEREARKEYTYYGEFQYFLPKD